MTVDVQSLANANAVAADNVQFVVGANAIPRKVLIIGTFDPAKTSVVPNVKVRVFSPEDVGAQFGFGSMVHRMAIAEFKGGRGIETFVIPQTESGTQAAGSVTFDTSGTIGGTVFMYIAGDIVSFDVLTGDTSDDIANKAIVAVNADPNLPVTALIDGGVSDQMNLTAKMKADFYGNEISIAFNLNEGQELPGGVSQITVAMAGGVGTPDIAPALDSLGTGDDANKDFFTDAVHGYGLESLVLDDISTYVGEGNGKVGTWASLVARPMRFLTGDVTPDTAGLNALIVISDGRLLDRANGVISAPGSQSHPSEIASQAMGHMARINNNRPEESYTGIVLEGVWIGPDATRWTKNYNTGRDLAVKKGISPTKLENNSLVMQNVVTFYRPANVAVESNGYRSQRNISILQNILANVKLNFAQEKWKGISIVLDTTEVTNVNARKKARDTGSVIDDLLGLAESFAGLAWLFTAQFTIDQLKLPGAVVIRPGGTGFDNIMRVVLSGEGGILNTVVEFDTSLTVVLG